MTPEDEIRRKVTVGWIHKFEEHLTELEQLEEVTRGQLYTECAPVLFQALKDSSRYQIEELQRQLKELDDKTNQ